MKSNNTSILFITLMMLAAVSVISSCKKGNQAPVINITAPTSNYMFTLPDSLQIAGTATDDNALHVMSIMVIKSNGDTAFQVYPTVQDLKTYSFNYYFHPAAMGDYVVHVTAQDNVAAKTEKVISVMAM